MKKGIRRMIVAGICALVLCMFAGCGNAGGGNAGGAGADAGKTAAEALSDSDAEQTDGVGIHHAEIVVKDYGTIKIELAGDVAPITVENFMQLAKDGFYDGLTFHRIMDGFMIQGGDPAQSGSSDKQAESIVGEFADNGYDNDISHVEGVISMARTSDPDSASSQFFITVADSEFLDGQYAAFGYVTDGLDIAKKIAKDAKPIDDNGTIPFEEQPVIESITITD